MKTANPNWVLHDRTGRLEKNAHSHGLMTELHDRTGRLEKTLSVLMNTFLLHDRTGRLEMYLLHLITQ
ncbi:Heat shock protein GrpE [Moraxella catarrhalis]|uniref:Heat shock protein GrpE n=1 Tax=Moraxella catarrhalis TaxID=480 RepID=A0A198UK84_MORCA|nr:Heat shock protein GrpE [Moraxella catarrhalis]